MNTIYDFKAKDANGVEHSLSEYKGKLLLVVNVASQCGFTPQYQGLEKLYREYKDKGLVILGFPCNQFGAQEPGNEEEIKKFCSLNYDVTFPLMAKVNVNGDNAHPIFAFLKSTAPGVLGTQLIKWNFTKFLISSDGQSIHRFAPNTTPESIEKEIKKILLSP